MPKIFVNQNFILFGDKINKIKYPIKRFLYQESNIKQFETLLARMEQREYKLGIYIEGDEQLIWRDLKKIFIWVEAAGGIVKSEKENFLLIYRRERWDLPKGKAENKETPMQTALREVEEECGISGLKITKELSATYHMYKENNGYYLKKTHWFYMVVAGEPLLTPQTEEAIENAIWTNHSNVGVLLQKSYLSLYDLWIKSS